MKGIKHWVITSLCFLLYSCPDDSQLITPTPDPVAQIVRNLIIADGYLESCGRASNNNEIGMSVFIEVRTYNEFGELSDELYPNGNPQIQNTTNDDRVNIIPVTVPETGTYMIEAFFNLECDDCCFLMNDDIGNFGCSQERPSGQPRYRAVVAMVNQIPGSPNDDIEIFPGFRLCLDCSLGC